MWIGETRWEVVRDELVFWRIIRSWRETQDNSKRDLSPGYDSRDLELNH
jgi:hypothetical protein